MQSIHLSTCIQQTLTHHQHLHRFSCSSPASQAAVLPSPAPSDEPNPVVSARFDSSACGTTAAYDTAQAAQTAPTPADAPATTPPAVYGQISPAGIGRQQASTMVSPRNGGGWAPTMGRQVAESFSQPQPTISTPFSGNGESRGDEVNGNQRPSGPGGQEPSAKRRRIEYVILPTSRVHFHSPM